MSQIVGVREPRATPRDSVGAGATAMLISRLVVAACGWTGSLIIARQLSTSAWGGYSFIFGLLGIIGLLVDLQVGRIVLRQVLDAGDDAGRVIGSYVTLRFVVAVIAYAAAVAFVILGGYDGPVVAGTMVAGLSFLFAGTGNGLGLWFQAKLWLRPGAIFAVLAAVTQLILVFALATGDQASIVKFGATAVIADAVIAIARWLALRRYHLRLHLVVEPARWWEWFKESVPLAIGFGLVTLYYKVDIVMLGQLDTLESVGRYGIGYKFADVVSFIPQALMTPVMTLMVAAWPHDRETVQRHYRQAFLLLFIAAVVIGVGFALVAQPAIATLYGDRYASSAWAARFLVAGAALQFFSYLCFITMISVGRRAPYTIAGVLGLVLNTGLNFALIPAFSFNGSAVATVITEVVVVTYLLVALRQTPGIVSVPWSAIIRTVGAGVAMTAVYVAVSRVAPWPGAVAAAGITFLTVLHVLGAEGPGGLRGLWYSARFDAGQPEPEPPEPLPLPPHAPVAPVAAKRPRAPRGASIAARTPVALIAVAANAAVVLTFVAARPAVPLLLMALVGAPILAAGVYAVWTRPQRGVLLLAALLPFDGLQPILGFPAGWKEALVLVTLAATWSAPVSARGAPGRPIPSWFYAAGAFAGLGAVSAAYVGGTRGLVGLKVGFFFLLVALIIWRCPFGRRERDQLVTILMITGFITAVYGIVQQIIGAAGLVELGYDYDTTVRFTQTGGFLRSFSTFDVNFPFALFLMLVLLVGVPSALEEPRRPRNQFFFLSIPILLAALVFTVTRGAWIGLGIGLVYIGLTRYRAVLKGMKHAAVLGVVALVFAGSYTTAFLSDRSTGQRVDLWRQNVADIAEHPLGIGIGATGSAAAKAQEVAGAERSEILAGTFQPDNSYFKTTLELGAIGLWLFVMLLVTSFKSTHAAARRLEGRDAALATGAAALVLAAAVVSLVATFFEVFPLDVYFWMLVAIVTACAAESR